MRRFLSLWVAAWWFALGSTGAMAQEETPAPAALPGEPAPAAPAAPEAPPYPLDLPELHPPNNGTGLFPNGTRQNPPAKTNPGRSGRSKRSALLTGTKQRGRSLDRVQQKADSDPLAIRVAYRRDKTTVLARNPELLALLRRADGAGTDVQKRAILREYYTRLFAEIQRIDSTPGMQQHLTLLAQVAGQRYDPQRRVVAGEEDLLETREGTGNVRLGR